MTAARTAGEGPKWSRSAHTEWLLTTSSQPCDELGSNRVGPWEYSVGSASEPSF